MISGELKIVFKIAVPSSQIKEIYDQQNNQWIIEFFKELYFLDLE